MKHYEYILFDWDGCLARTLEVWLEAYHTVLKRHGVEASDGEIAQHFGDWKFAKHFGLENHEEVNTELADEGRKHLQTVELFSGVQAMLDKLVGHKKLAILSSSSRDILQRGLDHNNIAGYFDVVLSGDDVTNHKPDPEVIHAGLAKLNGNPETAIMIGDSHKDIEAAKNAGIDSALIYHANHDVFYDLEHLQSYEPTYTVRGYDELTKILLG